MNKREVVVVGGGIIKFAAERIDSSVRDLVIEAVMTAIEDAGVELSEIEHGLTSYESDHFNRQMTLGAILHDHIGMVPKPNVRVEGGAATGRRVPAFMKPIKQHGYECRTVQRMGDKL